MVFPLRFASFQTAKDQATQRRSRETGAIAFSARFVQYSNDPPLLLSVAAVIQVFAWLEQIKEKREEKREVCCWD